MEIIMCILGILIIVLMIIGWRRDYLRQKNMEEAVAEIFKKIQT